LSSGKTSGDLTYVQLESLKEIVSRKKIEEVMDENFPHLVNHINGHIQGYQNPPVQEHYTMAYHRKLLKNSYKEKGGGWI
jgi:hypothetical protein